MDANSAPKTNQVDAQVNVEAEKQKQLVNQVREFTRAEVAKHATENDCWIVYKNEVFDVTSFVHLHPAGPNYLLDYAGEDTSMEFDQVGHSELASKQLQSFKIGNVAESDHQEVGAVAATS